MRLIKAMQMPLDLTALSKVLYFDGAQAVRPRIIGTRRDQTRALTGAGAGLDQGPKFPLTGAMMQKAGMADGPEMGQMARWSNGG